MSTRNTKRRPGRRPDSFFARELRGETPLAFTTARTLCEAAAHFAVLRPWEVLNEEQAVLVQLPGEPETHACSVMGALGQTFAMVVYLGSDNFHLFRRFRADENMDPGEFFAAQRSVTVEFVKSGAMSAPDRHMLQAVGCSAPRGLAPVFRAVRPGYHPWYVTEDEGGRLAACTAAVIAFFLRGKGRISPDVWERGMYPLLTWTGSDMSFREVAPPRPVAAMPVLPAPDPARVARIRDSAARSTGVLELDHFHTFGVIGPPHQRPARMRVALAVDAATGMAYAPQAAMPETPTGEMLANVLLDAIEATGQAPREVRVRDSQHRLLLAGLAQALGFAVVVGRLPALDSAKAHLSAMLDGDRPRN